VSIDFDEINSFLLDSEKSLEEINKKINKIKEMLSILDNIENYGITNLTIKTGCEHYNLFNFLKEEKSSIINYLKILLEYKLHKLKGEVDDCISNKNGDLLQRLKDMGNYEQYPERYYKKQE